MVSKSEIIRFLSEKNTNISFIDKLKVKYRPIICPFVELLAYIENNKYVFDIGCGSGQFCSLIDEFTEAENIFGIEISENLVLNAKKINSPSKKNKKIQFEKYNGIDIPQVIQNYDLIYLIDVLHHIPQKNQNIFLKEIYSKMKFGSTLVLKDIDANHSFVYFNKLHDLIFSREIGHELTCSKTTQLATQLGFKIKEIKKMRMFLYPHYFLIIEK